MELNKQFSAGIILVFPLAVCFVYLAPLFISFLYSKDFAISTQYTDFAIFGTILIVASNCMGMIFMAKMASKLYLGLVLAALFSQLCLYVPLYHFWGLRGLGISYIMNGVIGISLFGTVLYKKYRISLSYKNVIMIVVVVATIALALIARNLSNSWAGLAMGAVIFIGSAVFSYIYLKKEMGIDIVQVVKNYFRSKK